MVKMTCQKCSWMGVFGDEPCMCGLSYMDFEESWNDLPSNLIVIDEGARTAVVPYFEQVWNLA